jgi:hypothetical protein
LTHYIGNVGGGNFCPRLWQGDGNGRSRLIGTEGIDAVRRLLPTSSSTSAA